MILPRVQLRLRCRNPDHVKAERAKLVSVTGDTLMTVRRAPKPASLMWHSMPDPVSRDFASTRGHTAKEDMWEFNPLLAKGPEWIATG